MAALGALVVPALELLPLPRLPGEVFRELGPLLMIPVPVFVYGLICGASLLAGERESGTLAFLDTQLSRTQLWAAKLLIGALLTLGQAVWLVGLLLLVTPVPNERVAVLLLLLTIGAGLMALAWGMFASAFCRRVLSATILALALYLLCVLLSWIIPLLLAWLLRLRVLMDLGPYVLEGLTVACLFGSWLLFCYPIGDWTETGLFQGWKSVLWLSWRQSRGLGLGLAIGMPWVFLMLLSAGLGIWPAGTLVLGIVCGTAVFAGEQSGASGRFLGEQRLPLGRIWTFKIGYWLLLATVVVVEIGLGLLLVGAAWAAGSSATQFVDMAEERSLLSRHLGIDRALLDITGAGIMLPLWLLYGFSITQLFTLALRKTVPALFLSTAVSFTLLFLWLPSLVCGGLRAWQLFAPPILFLACSRLLMWTWASDHLHGWKLAAILAGLGLVTVLWVAGSIAYRVTEVPDLGEPFELRPFLASLPGPERNQAGQFTRSAVEKYMAIQRTLPGPLRRLLSDRLQRLEPWRDYSPVLEPGLNRIFEFDWASDLRKAAWLPVGLVDSPRSPSGATRVQTAYSALEMSVLLGARVLQRVREAPERSAALDYLNDLLALTRNLRRAAPNSLYNVGLAGENGALDVVEEWLDLVGPRPALLKNCQAILESHDRQRPSYEEHVQGQYLFARNLVETVGTWEERPDDRAFELLGLALHVPWEKTRSLRLLNLVFAGHLQTARTPYWEIVERYGGWEPLARHLDQERNRQWLDPFGGPATLKVWIPPEGQEDPTFRIDRLERLLGGDRPIVEDKLLRIEGSPPRRENALRHVRAARLLVALSRFALARKRPAQNLAELVPEYLPELPFDPYNGQPFHYRVSIGGPEDMNLPEPIHAGQGVVWSVGYDGNGDGKRHPEREDQGQARRRFHPVYVVPRWTVSEP
jgi:hypothetical protein